MKKTLHTILVLSTILLTYLPGFSQSADIGCRKYPTSANYTDCISMVPAPESRIDNADGTTTITFLLSFDCSGLSSIRQVEFSTLGPIKNATSSYSFFTLPLLQFPGTSNPNTWNYAPGQPGKVIYNFRAGSFNNNEARFTYTLNTTDFDNQASLSVRIVVGGFTIFDPAKEYRINYGPFDLLNCGITNPVVLPVELLSFTGSATKNGVQLAWSTATEKDNDFFTIEQSQDGQLFKEVAQVKGAGNSTQKLHYNYVHKNVTSSLTYYRLKQTDLDGTVSYSKIVAVENKNLTPVISVYPNPGSGKFNLQSTDQIIDAQIADATGRTVKKLSNLNQDHQIDLTDQKNGLYFLRLTTATEVKTLRLLKE